MREDHCGMRETEICILQSGKKHDITETEKGKAAGMRLF